MNVERALRRGLLAIIALGSLGVLVELGLIGHYDDPWQYSPLVLLALVLAATLAVAVAPGRRTLLAYRALMAVCVISGVVGHRLHYAGNMEFELEVFPNMAGWELFREVVTGATPVLAPGTMAVIGLLGLLAVWRQPQGSGD
jgi:hypothetical protein